MKAPETLMTGVKHVPYGGKLHETIIKNFKSRLRIATDEQRKKRDAKWKESEDIFTAYMPETEIDSIRKDNRKAGQTEYTTISIPYSYAMLLTSHTYYTSVFLARDPLFQMQGRHGESQTAESAIESLLDYQLTTGGNLPPLFIWLMDVGKYGHGVLGQYWDKEEFTFSKIEEVPRTFLGVPLPGATEKKMISTTEVGYEGMRFYNVRPQDFFTDPRVPLMRFQDGEFCIVFDKIGWAKFITGVGQGRYFNVAAVKNENDSPKADRGATGYDTNLPGQDLNIYTMENGRPAELETHEFHWTVIPKEIGLGSSSRPEKWVFTIANERVVIGAQPLGLIHNRYPFDVLQCEIEGYNVYNRSMLEILTPLNQTMEWLFNSHFYNVRSALNNMFLIDPSKVNTRDLEDPGPGKMVRLKPAGYGQDVRTLMTQFPVQDITRANLQDSTTVGQLAQFVTGVNENIMGSVNTGGRKTATEIRQSSTFGINRLKTNCEWMSATGFSPLASKMTMTTQQLYSAEKKFRIVGDQAQWGQQYLDVTPQMIAGFFDFVPIDGTMPVDRFAQVNLWQQLMGSMAKVPGALQQYDLSKIFAFVAQLGGLKNINRFRIQVVPDGLMQQQAGAGNVVPLRTNPNEPGQIPGMGATG